MKRKYIIIVAILLLVPIAIHTVGFLKLRSKKTITLTLWHNYGGQMKSTMDEMIEEFNGTVGEEEGVFINVTSISGTATLEDKLFAAANGDPGAEAMPDITTAYPRAALVLSDKNLLVDLDELFTKKELDAYIPRFIEEGRLTDNKLYVFPTAKSTEVLFINTTIFNRFAAECGVTLDDLRTFEGIFKASRLYYEWTDSHTPDIPNDGKAFYVPDSVFNLSLVGCKQLGSSLIKDDTLDFSGSDTKLMWNSYMEAAVPGHVAIFSGYASDLAKTGDVVCSTGSTAGVMFFSPTVTYPDNTTEEAKLAILPYPTFEGGKKIAIQRGAGMCVTRSNKEKEHLAGIFLKWFTSPENNLRFVSSTGYLPVTEEAFGDIMLKEIAAVPIENIKELLKVSRQMQMEYDFFMAPIFDGVSELQENYESEIKAMASQVKEDYFKELHLASSEEALKAALEGRYEEFQSKITSVLAKK